MHAAHVVMDMVAQMELHEFRDAFLVCFLYLLIERCNHRTKTYAQRARLATAHIRDRLLVYNNQSHGYLYYTTY
jgi:hypothetical protein